MANAPTSAPLPYDAIIVGGGLVGLTLAIALAAHDIRAAIVERADPDQQLAAGFDGRVSAIASSAAHMFRALGFADMLAEDGCAINSIRVHDGRSPKLLRFDAADSAAGGPLGIMLENRLLRAHLLRRLRATANVDLYAPATIREVARTDTGASVTLADGRALRAPVILACDGRGSALRQQAGIRVAQWRYDATAIVSMFTHARPHDHVAAELFYPAGPLAQLPMPDLADGRHRSALVWTVRQRAAAGMLALSDDAFAEELQAAMGDQLGTTRLIAPRQSFPLGLLHAERYWAKRLILVGDAAHGIHPVAGQGLNLGLRDVAALAEVLASALRLGLDIGHPDVARRYERWRRTDNFTTAFATDALVRLFAIPGRPARLLRTTGLAAVNRLPRLRRAFMAIARGESGDRPPLLHPAPDQAVSAASMAAPPPPPAA